MTMILMLNLKGGVAKTTNAVAIAETLAHRGKKVLLIDADHQYTATELMLGEAAFLFMEKYKRTLHDLLARMLDESFDPKTIGNFVAPAATNIAEIKDRIDCIPCSYRIDDIQTNMAKARRGYQTTKEFLQKWKRQQKVFQSWCEFNYEYAIVDCPPSIALQVKFFLNCADYYISPSIPDRLSLRGTDYLVERI
ncbi:AAA family ATPase, partial [bacterium]|nr:AAA family ATPase [bacterium]